MKKGREDKFALKNIYSTKKTKKLSISRKYFGFCIRYGGDGGHRPRV